MKLVIKDYLLQLKESKELDALLPDLLLEMNIIPISKPLKGNRQNGVDIAALKQEENGVKTLYLFVIKSGHLGRNDWDGSGPQAIRPSLDDIKDTYLKQLHEDYKKLPKKIILVTSGDIRQDTLPSWQGYVDRNKEDNLGYDFWNGDYLATKIEELLLNERILPDEMRAHLIKTLVFLNDSDYSLSDFYKLLNKHFLNCELTDNKNKNSELLLKKFRLINLILNIIYRWSQTNENIKPALIAAERSMLTCWEMLRSKDFLNDKKLMCKLNEIYDTWFNISEEYFYIIQPLTNIEDGLCTYANDFSLQSLNLFEILGFISLYGLSYLYKIKPCHNKNDITHLLLIKNTICNILKNNKGLYSPVYDNHIIEISLTLLFLSQIEDYESIQNWIVNLATYISFSYINQSKYFPIDSESLENLILLNIKHEINKEEFFTISTLLPTLMEWSCVLNLPIAYKDLKEKFSLEIFKDCDFQIWYPDKNTENYMYKFPYETLETGITENSLKKDMEMDDMKKRIQSIKTKVGQPEDFSSIVYNFEILSFMASRHFRIPVFPFFWETLLEKFEFPTVKQNLPLLLESKNVTWLNKSICCRFDDNFVLKTSFDNIII